MITDILILTRGFGIHLKLIKQLRNNFQLRLPAPAADCYNSPMNRKEIVDRLQNAHQHLDVTLQKLSEHELNDVAIYDEGWTVKDILAHLAAWNHQFVKDIDAILNNQMYTFDNDQFNADAIKERKDRSYSEVYDEWTRSFMHLVAKIQSLSDKEWAHTNTDPESKNSQFESILSLFSYRYKGKVHEDGHADDIISFFDL